MSYLEKARVIAAPIINVLDGISDAAIINVPDGIDNDTINLAEVEIILDHSDEKRKIQM